MIDLKTILKEYPNCLSSRTAFKSVLMDKYPLEKRMVNILTILFECGVANKIKTKKTIGLNEMQNLIAQIENEYGISEKYSQEAVLVWATAYEVKVSAVKTTSSQKRTTLSENQLIDYVQYNSDNSLVWSADFDVTKTIPVNENKPIEYVQGDVDDYDVVQKADGYYINRFKGFEEEEMTIPSLIDGKNIKGIASDAFKGCIMVKKIVISEGIEIIENSAFKGCKALENVLLPNTLCRIGSESNEYGVGAFSSTNLKEIEIPQNVEFMGPYTFSFCQALKQVILPDNITTICQRTFAFCRDLTNVKLPSNLLMIREEAFESSGIRELHIPLGTKKIEKSAFKNSKLSKIYIPPTVTEIDPGTSKYYSCDDSLFGERCDKNNLTIYCTAGSAAMKYARENNIKCAKAQF